MLLQPVAERIDHPEAAPAGFTGIHSRRRAGRDDPFGLERQMDVPQKGAHRLEGGDICAGQRHVDSRFVRIGRGGTRGVITVAHQEPAVGLQFPAERHQPRTGGFTGLVRQEEEGQAALLQHHQAGAVHHQHIGCREGRLRQAGVVIAGQHHDLQPAEIRAAHHRFELADIPPVAVEQIAGDHQRFDAGREHLAEDVFQRLKARGVFGAGSEMKIGGQSDAHRKIVALKSGMENGIPVNSKENVTDKYPSIDKQTYKMYYINKSNVINKHKMNTLEQRQKQIIDQIEQRGSVNVLELAETFGVSDMTIRRDLIELEKVGLIRRIHGGAVSARGRSYEPPLALRNMENKEIKQVLGKYASGMVAEGDSIALDVGSTTYEIANNLRETRNITVVTPSIPIASLFFDRSDVRLIMPGGVVRPGETSMIGDIARRSLEYLFVDRLFLGVGAVDSQIGLTEYNMDDAAVKQTMIKTAKEVVVVADSSKFQKIAFTFIADFKSIHHFITNQEPPKELVAALKDNNVTIHIIDGTNIRIL